MRQVSIKSGSSYDAFHGMWIADADTSLVGLSGNDEFIVSTNPDVVLADWNNSNIPSAEQMWIHHYIEVGQTSSNPILGLNFPISKGRQIFVAFSSTSVFAQLYIEDSLI